MQITSNAKSSNNDGLGIEIIFKLYTIGKSNIKNIFLVSS